MINIVFEGSPGAGKTTIIKNIINKLKANNIKVGNTIDIDPSTPLYPILHSMNNNTPLVTDNNNFSTVLYETFVQVSDYLYARERLFADKNEINIFDRSYFSIYAYQKVLLQEKYGKSCSNLLKNLLQILKFENKNIDVVFYFIDKEDIYIERAEKRDNKKYSNYEIEMLKKFEKELDEIVLIDGKYKIVKITNYNLDETTDKIYNEILSVLKGE